LGKHWENVKKGICPSKKGKTGFHNSLAEYTLQNKKTLKQKKIRKVSNQRQLQSKLIGPALARP